VDLTVDGAAAGAAVLPFYMRVISSVGSSVGFDHGSAVSPRHAAPFSFTGTLEEVEIQLPDRATADAEAAVASGEMSRQRPRLFR